MKLSVLVLTKDEEENLPRLLESLKLLPVEYEVVVVDSGSTDGTPEIARRYGAKFVVREWRGYVEQRRYALTLARGEWVLFMDADEWITPALAGEIAGALDGGYDGYVIPRRNVYLGKLQRMKPTALLRLARKGKVRIRGRYVHEYLEVEGRVGRLKGYIGHRPYRSLLHHWSKNTHYATLSAREKLEAGRGVSWADLLLRFPLMFLRYYILQWAFLDGKRGLIYSLSQAWYHFQKYALLYEARRGHP
ncbi:MAG: glycosyltransferase family 2 protein [Thermotogae bacterium]|nr:glycosyltransferase family 2 protein [Thermotogota bacterium]